MKARGRFEPLQDFSRSHRLLRWINEGEVHVFCLNGPGLGQNLLGSPFEEMEGLGP